MQMIKKNQKASESFPELWMNARERGTVFAEMTHRKLSAHMRPRG